MRKWLALWGTIGCGCSGEPPATAVDGSTSSSAGTSVAPDGSTTAASSGSDAADVTSSSSTSSSSSDDASNETTDGPKFDVERSADVGRLPCEPPSPPTHLWVTNHSEGTISKIDTATATEVGRYLAREDGFGSPMTASVAMSGNVAVVNSYSGVTKIYADASSCIESNGDAGIQTSTSSTFLPWEEEECRAWHTPFAYQSQRPVAWVRGEFDAESCSYVDELLWVAGRTSTAVDVLLLDGETGVVIDQVQIVGLVDDSFYGLFSGAVDSEGNFWAAELGSGSALTRVGLDDLDAYEVWYQPIGPHWYDLTVDDHDQVWICSTEVARFDDFSGTFLQAMAGAASGGCMAAAGDDGLLWIAGGENLFGVDRDSLNVEAEWPIPDDGGAGVSVDYDGYVWFVETDSTSVYRVDPLDGTMVSYDGLPMRVESSKGDLMGYALRNLP